MSLKDGLSELLAKLTDVETAARKLQNKNFADIVASAKGRVQQLIDHPDVDLVGGPHDEPTTKDEAIGRMRADGDADPEGTAKMNWPHLFAEPLPGTGDADPEGTAKMNWPHLFAEPLPGTGDAVEPAYDPNAAV